MNWEWITKRPSVSVTCTECPAQDGVRLWEVAIHQTEARVPEAVTLRAEIPCVGAYSLWAPSFDGSRHLAAEWGKHKAVSRLASWMPLMTATSRTGNNVLSVALSDVSVPSEIGFGVREEDSMLVVDVSLFTVPTAPMADYRVVLRADTRPLPFYETVRAVSRWWETDGGYLPAPVPDAARLPMDSLWYSFHQRLNPEEILKQCEQSHALGMDTVIVDDGWQTDDNNRGYAYCGDWEVTATKFPDMRGFVESLHRIGMKIMLWYSVPFVGKYSKAYQQFEDCLLDCPGTADWKCFDPRYPAVREYLQQLYVQAVRDWDLDGMKLDFIDSFALYGETATVPDPRRDYESLEAAINRLMLDVTAALRALKPDFLIEFRQSYIGPAVRQYGNMLRVADCPNDALYNRKATLDMRLTSGGTPVHSDMLMWNVADTVETAATQLVSVLYAVPQISMRIDRLPAEHRVMLRYYLAFWREHREILLDGELTVTQPESNYGRVCAVLGDRAVVTAYNDSVVPVPARDTAIVNGTDGTGLILRDGEGSTYTVTDCCGHTVASGAVTTALQELTVPRCGIVFLKK